MEPSNERSCMYVSRSGALSLAVTQVKCQPCRACVRARAQPVPRLALSDNASYVKTTVGESEWGRLNDGR